MLTSGSRLNKYFNWVIAISFLTMYSCSSILQAPKYEFSDGFYKLKLAGSKPTKVYVENEADSIVIYLLRRQGKTYTVNTSTRRNVILRPTREDSLFQKSIFTHQSLDIDFLTIPFTYRPPAESFPRQFSSNFNGVLYLGFRKDIYSVKYDPLIMGTYKRNITHYGLSMGAFSGLGSTTMNFYVTNNAISIEYDGLVWMKGISFIMGVQNFTVGAAVGWDNLLDQNRKYWIYQGKPWMGVAVGFNLF